MQGFDACRFPAYKAEDLGARRCHSRPSARSLGGAARTCLVSASRSLRRLVGTKHGSLSGAEGGGQHAGAFSGRRRVQRGGWAADWGLSTTSPQTQANARVRFFWKRQGEQGEGRAAGWGVSTRTPQTQHDDLCGVSRGVAGELVAVVAGACEPPERQRRTARRGYLGGVWIGWVKSGLSSRLVCAF